MEAWLRKVQDYLGTIDHSCFDSTNSKLHPLLHCNKGAFMPSGYYSCAVHCTRFVVHDIGVLALHILRPSAPLRADKSVSVVIELITDKQCRKIKPITTMD